MKFNFAKYASVKKITIATSLILSFSTASYGATLQDAVNQTLTSHPDILSSKSEQAASASDIRRAEGGKL